jgi:hypothetical protein
MHLYLKGFVTAGAYLARCGIADIEPLTAGSETNSLPLLWRQALDIEKVFLLASPRPLFDGAAIAANLFAFEYPCQVKSNTVRQNLLFGSKKGQRLELWQEQNLLVLQRTPSNTTPLFLISDYCVERIGALTEWTCKGEQLLLAGGVIFGVVPTDGVRQCVN